MSHSLHSQAQLLSPDLTRFFSPRRVAIVGASEDLSKFSGRLMRQTIDFGFAGTLYPINPRREQIYGLQAFPSLEALPEAPDHVGLVLPAEAVPAALQECAQMKVPFATVFSAGFAEQGTSAGKALQNRILTIARDSGIRLMGPNCNGLVNFVDRFAMTSTVTLRGPRRAAGDIGVVSQSGAVGQVSIMWRAQQEGLGISYQVSCGNACDLDLVDYAMFMLETEMTRVVVIHAERLPELARLRALTQKAHTLDKAVVLLKAGRTAAGSRAAASHTGALTGADEVCDAALRQLGIVRVDDCDELYQTAMLLRRGRAIHGRGAAVASFSGGNGVIAADLGEREGIEWPAYAPDTVQALRALLPGYATVSNPTDLTAGAIGQPDMYGQAVETILRDPAVNVMVPVLTIATAHEVRRVADLSARSEKAVAILWSGFTSDDPALEARTLVAEGHAVYRDTHSCMKAVRRAMDLARSRERLHRPDPQRPAGIDAAGARALLARSRGKLSEAESKALLACYGLPLTREALATSPGQAAEIAQTLGGPVALKILSPDIAHKTEAGAIRLGVTGEAAVAAAFDDVLASALAWAPKARIDGVLVQEMITGGHEMFLGISQDPTFGPVLAFGQGGIHVEVLKDVIFRLPPFSADDAQEALRELRCWPLLLGARGAPAADVPALADAIERMSWLAADLSDVIGEVDLNPLAVLRNGQGVRALDALVVPRQLN